MRLSRSIFLVNEGGSWMTESKDIVEMKSVFGSKRKPRKIEVDEDDEALTKDGFELGSSTASTRSYNSPSNTARKVFKKSSLRKSIILDDDDIQESTLPLQDTVSYEAGESIVLNNSDAELPRTTTGRSGSANKKKKATSSRLSFGLGGVISGGAAEELEGNENFSPKKSALSRKAIESNTLRKSLPAYQIRLRSGEDEEDRPIYSKDYLNELKSSTPSTPKDLHALSMIVDEKEGLDESELDGAMIVDNDDRTLSMSGIHAIPTEAEIREKKERRARLAHEKDFISLNDDGSDSRQQISLLPGKKKAETRLVREDEDIAEGFDEFVEDGRISLGKKAEREARRRQRAAMAELINEAEGSSSNDSDDSEAERRAAFELAQTRAGMDGLSKLDSTTAVLQIPPKITLLPNISDCLQRLQATLNGMEQELARRNAKMAELQQEKKEILAREEEVQRLLKEAGDRYSAMRADTGLPPVDAKTLIEGQNGYMEGIDTSRGLESFGNTPTARPNMDDVG